HVIEEPETVATASRIGNPASWNLATNARDESGGKITSVTEEEILEAFNLIARKEGIFAEPGSCASIAGIIQQCKNGTIKPGTKIAAVLTGNGLKDPQTAIDQQEIKPVPLPNDEDVITDFIKDTVAE